ncbi:MAG: ABC transporter ATP-binding protein [Lachnospiraceae bacterium]|nr:ABC transporter ATP-binding protein [Lachnospiraceae bacterium]
MITVGNVIKYVGSLLELGNSVGEIMRTYVDMEIYSGFYIYYIEFLEMENEKYEGTLPIEKRDDNEYELEFKDVSFRYPNSEKYALSHVSLKMKIGGKMAVVGKNGAGKTTFIKLLCRLYDPTEGEILLNGINIKYYDYDEYMRIFSVVFQDFKLFSFSLAENVAASWKYDKDRVAECLKQAGFEKRLQEMPEGIETNLYQMQDNGVEISGGEAQKVAIARALYKNSPVVILDEPTSALDPVSEYDIYKRFNELVKDKTAIYISHRMSSCRFCETVLVFDGGRIVQEGSHEQLVENTDGIYYKMWSAQAKYYQKG